MLKMFKKEPIWFAVILIAVYVVGFSLADQISEFIGYPKLITMIVGAAFSIIIYTFSKKNDLNEYLGLRRVEGNAKKYLYFVPLIIITSVNLWNGVTWNYPFTETIFYIASMIFVGFLEEVIFRGFLFKGMSKDGLKLAIVVSALTFGIGHIVNLLTGAPLFDTMLQLVYASAIGFCFTAIFHVSGSIVPCIIAHVIVNSSSVFAVEPNNGFMVLISFVQTLIGISYGVYLLRKV